MPGEYTARMNSGLVPLIGPNRASTWSLNRRADAARPHPSPNARAKKGPSDLMVIGLFTAAPGRG